MFKAAKKSSDIALRVFAYGALNTPSSKHNINRDRGIESSGSEATHDWGSVSCPVIVDRGQHNTAKLETGSAAER